MIKMDVIGSDLVASRLQALPDAIRKRVIFGVQEATNLIAKKAKANAAALFQTSESIQDSIRTRYELRGPSIVGVVESEGPEYLKILHFGGVTRPHMIFPTNRQSLAFDSAVGRQFAAYVRHPGSIFPPRPYLQQARVDAEDEVVEIMERAITEAVREAGT